MGLALKIVGGLWALLGVVNLVSMFGATKSGDEGIQLLGLLVNMIGFVLPGLGLAGLGEMLARRASRETPDVERRIDAAVRRALDEERAQVARREGMNLDRRVE